MPKASVLLKELEQAVPAGVAKLNVEVGVVDVDDELDESLPPPPQATKQIKRQERRGCFRLVIVGVIEEIILFISLLIFYNTD